MRLTHEGPTTEMMEDEGGQRRSGKVKRDVAWLVGGLLSVAERTV